MQFGVLLLLRAERHKLGKFVGGRIFLSSTSRALPEVPNKEGEREVRRWRTSHGDTHNRENRFDVAQLPE